MFFLASSQQLAAKRASNKQTPTSPFPAGAFKFAPDDEMYKARFGFQPKTLHKHDGARGAEALPLAYRFYALGTHAAFGRMQDDGEYETNLDYYLNCMRDSDRHIGTVLGALDEHGLTEDTIVIFTSDHGEMAGEHGLRQKFYMLYKENLGIPFLVRMPGGRGGTVHDNVTQLIDVAPTLLSMAGMPDGTRARLYPNLHGSNLLPLIAGEPNAQLDQSAAFIFGNMDVRPPKDSPGMRPFCHAIITRRYKFGRFFAGCDGYRMPKSFEELLRCNDLVLHDTASDPDELLNLAATSELAQQHRHLIEELNAELNTLIARDAARDPWLPMPWAMEDEPLMPWDSKL